MFFGKANFKSSFVQGRVKNAPIHNKTMNSAVFFENSFLLSVDQNTIPSQPHSIIIKGD